MAKASISQKQDRFVYVSMRALALLVVLVLLALIVLLMRAGGEAFSQFGWSFITSSEWNPVEDQYGALPFIYGTVITSLIALLLATPVSIAVAIFINEVLPNGPSKLFGLFVEMIAAIPSIVFGLWGIFVLGPFVRDSLSPVLKEYLDFLPIFQGPSFGIGALTASIIIAIMIIPTITSICREVFKTVPQIRKEAALALGATRFEMIKIAIIKPSFSGIIGAMVLGLGRALGETMAVAMLIGNQPQISSSLFAPAATMASVIANEYAEADSQMHVSALCLIALLLFFVTFITNAFARSIVWANERKNRR
jgi:phosphate transport system permease protein